MNLFYLFIFFNEKAIEAEAKMKAAMQMNPGQAESLASFDPVPEITRRHFEEALMNARRSVTNVV